MKVIFVTNSTTVFGGGSKALVNMLNGLMEKGIEPLVIFPDTDGLCLQFKLRGIPTKILNYRIAVYPSTKSIRDLFLFLPRLIGRILLNHFAYLHLSDIVREFKPDLIHTNVSVIDMGYKTAVKFGIPHVWHIREYGDLDFKFYHYYNRNYFLRRLKRINSYSICITKDIQRYNQLLTHPNSRVIYDGVLSENMSFFRNDKSSYFLFAGRLEVNKGIAGLLSAYADFRKKRPDSPMRLKIAGDTKIKSYSDFLHSESDRLGITPYVDFLGMRRDVLDLMANTYLMVVPSPSEGFGFITAEAMFRGALVLGRDTAGTKEQFDNGLELTGSEIGLRYHSHDELVRYMCDVADHGIASYFPMIHKAQQVVRSLYSSERHVEQVYDFYKYILNK